MPSSRIIEPLDIVEHIGPCLIARPVVLAGRALGLEGREEAIHRRVVIDLIRSNHTLTLGANIENLTLTGIYRSDGTGNALDNVIAGSQAENILYGGAGNDRLDGVSMGAEVSTNVGV